MIRSYQADCNIGFNVEINDFIGPINILVDLIQKKKISIYEISLNSIIKDFLKYLKKNKNVLLEELSSFLYVAALLLEIKAKSLIPSKNIEENNTHDDTNLEELKIREQEYKIFKEISDYFSELIENESVYFVREAPLEEHFSDFLPEIFKNIKLIDLYNLASKLLISKEEKISIADFYKEKITKTIFQEIARIKVILNRKKDVTFKELTNSYTNLTDIVICFLSILELYKNEIIDINQFELFGEILIKKINS
ncbi:MAG: segregation/condensation protein A [Actinobacteria bacterium]|nr:segregation/condensation protein A [Actinomycetota bacterium]